MTSLNFFEGRLNLAAHSKGPVRCGTSVSISKARLRGIGVDGERSLCTPGSIITKASSGKGGVLVTPVREVRGVDGKGTSAISVDSIVIRGAVRTSDFLNFCTVRDVTGVTCR